MLTAQIGAFLALHNPTEAQIKEAATLLLRCNKNRERGIYNQAMVRPKAMLPWIRTDLKKYYNIRKRGLTTADVEKYNTETIHAVRQTLSVVPETVDKDKAPLVPELGVRGKREDHDRLPSDIRDIWEKNAERWRQMRKLHAQLAQMIAKPNYAACDGNELCYQLRTLDTAIRSDYERYDTYVLQAESKKDSLEVYTDNVKTITNARSTISRGLSRKTPHTSSSLQKVQDAVNTLYALKQSVKPETADRLKNIGITLPQDA